MSQQNTALIDDIMAALDAESSQNVELIVRNTQNGATKKMALASLEQIIYSYLTTAPVVSNLASVLGAFTIPTAVTPVSGFSFNSAATNKVYFFSNSGTSDFGTSDCPQDSPSGSFSLLETWGYASWFKIQRFTNFGGCIYVRFYISGSWKPWKKFAAS